MHFDDVADVVHKGEHAHREEANGVEGEERSDNELLRTDVFQETEDAVDSDEEFEHGHPRELLGVVALGLLLGSAALRGADEAALATDDCGEHGAGVAYGNANAKGHQDGEDRKSVV